MSSTIDSVKNTFSSWDSCMSKTYCKWPVIAVIIIASLTLLSLLWCCARCLCCGVECCCGCCACCNSCCPSPRGKSREKYGGGGYQQAPPTPFGAGYSGAQYVPPVGMNTGYFGARGGGGGGGPTTATFESGRGVHEDSLPAMPSWDTAKSRRVDVGGEEVELDKLQPAGLRQQEVGLLAGAERRDERFEYGGRQEVGDGAVGGMQGGGGYYDYTTGQQHQQQYQHRAASPYAGQRSPDPYAQTTGGGGAYMPVTSPIATSPAAPYGSSAGYSPPPTATTAPYGSSADYYSGQQHHQQLSRGYVPSVAAPSYHTQDVGGAISPGGGQQHYQAFGRKPVQGSWREV